MAAAQFVRTVSTHDLSRIVDSVSSRPRRPRTCDDYKIAGGEQETVRCGRTVVIAGDTAENIDAAATVKLRAGASIVTIL